MNYVGELLSDKKITTEEVRIELHEDSVVSNYFFDKEGFISNWKYGYLIPARP